MGELSEEELALLAEKARRRVWRRQAIQRWLDSQEQEPEQRPEPGPVSEPSPAPKPPATREEPPSPALLAIFRQLQQPAGPAEWPRRVALWHQALSLLPKEQDPKHWAMLQYGLAGELANDVSETRAESLDGAIEAYRAALTVYNRQAFPGEWASTMYNLGALYSQRIRGNPTENLERKLEAFQEALTVYTREAAPQFWAIAQASAGHAYLRRKSGHPVENLESAIQALESALTVFSRKDSPMEWAAALRDLGEAYSLRRLGGEDTPERALRALEAALTVYTRDQFPESWADVQKELGRAYLYRIAGGRAENGEKAIAALQRALTVYTREAYPHAWASTQNALGIAWFERVQGDRSENLERSIAACREALTVWSREAFPDDWAVTQMNLGNTYLVRLLGDPGENLERAIAAYEAALPVFERGKARGDQGDAEQWASIESNLANAYSSRVRGERADNLERAIGACRLALTVITRDTYPGRWAGMMMSLGNLLKKRILGDPAENLRRAAAALEVSLMVAGSPEEQWAAAASLGRLQAELGRWDRAYFAFRAALDAAERLYTTGVTEEDKRAEITAHAGLYQSMVEACLRQYPPRNREAFLYAEEGRSRLLRDQLGTLTLPAPPSVPAELLESEARLLKRWREVEREIQAAAAPGGEVRLRAVAEAEAVRSQLESLWETLRREHGAADYVELRRGERLEWEEVQLWLAAQGCQVALLEFFTRAGRLIAFVVRTGSPEPVPIELDVSMLEVEEWKRQFLDQAHQAGRGRRRSETADPPSPSTRGGLPAPWLDRVMPHLQGVELLYVIPHGGLHRLPIHALEYQGMPLIERFPVAYAPSAAVLLRTARPGSPALAPVEGDVLVIGDPSINLPAAGDEAESVAARFGVLPVLGDEATLSYVSSRLAGTALLHFAGHAHFDEEDPFASGLLLAGNEVLSAREVLARSLRTPLVVLSGCQTGVQEVRAGDELMGLVRAFLYAGATSLVVSQWKVEDTATSWLMERFYGHLFDNRIKKTSVAQALQAAVLETRDEFPEPYDWASFLLFGAWH